MPKVNKPHSVSDVLVSLQILHDELLPLYAIFLQEYRVITSLNLSRTFGLSAKKQFPSAEYANLAEWHATRKASKNRKGSKSPKTIRLDVFDEEFQGWLFGELESHWRVIATWYGGFYSVRSWSAAGISKPVTVNTFLDIEQKRRLAVGSVQKYVASRRRELEILIEELERGVEQNPQFANAAVDQELLTKITGTARQDSDDAPKHTRDKDRKPPILNFPTTTIQGLIKYYPHWKPTIRQTHLKARNWKP